LKLNSEQEKAVIHKDGPILIFAGAGSGKTRVITNRIINLIQSYHVEPSSIVALSFTNKSSKEMRERVRKMISRKESRGLTLSTFHSLGLNFLKKHIDQIGYHPNFILQTPTETESILVEILKQHKYDITEIKIPNIQSIISKIKNMGENYFKELQLSLNTNDSIAADIFPDYNKSLKMLNSVDFDDLILLPIRILKEKEEIKKIYQKKFQYIMIDEFQDTNSTQYELIKLLVNEKQNLCVVGDDDQSIYGFRGSDLNLILNFEKDFQNVQVVRLLQNYRSNDKILSAANSLIKNNTSRKEKTLWTNIISHEIPRYVEREDEKDEAIFIIDEIEKELKKNHIEGSEISILFRTNYQSRPFEEELRLRSIPYKLIGAYNFFDRKEVKDLISYIRVVANHKDELSLVRILNYPKRGIGQTSIAKLQQNSFEKEISIFEVLENICAEPEYIPDIKKNIASKILEFLELIQKYRTEFFSGQSMTETLKKFIKDIGFEREFSLEETDEKVIKARMYNLSEFVNMMSFFESDWDAEGKPNLFDFIYRLSLLTIDDDNEKKERDDRIQLMTMHLSKGLEFDVVFLVGLEEGVLPSLRTIEETNSVDEERRLLYVGMTRAKKRLYLSRARNRKKYGETFPTEMSRFISEIPDDLLSKETFSSEESDFNLLDGLEGLK
jgi:DNA helicase II / ATP-dependent DNA helicase PcrA